MTLKVYRTAIGFHDAYVAAPSKKAALRAWGSDKDLFARGVAEIVEDGGKAAKQALAVPGEVVKIVRGTAAEHLAALPKDKAPSPKGKKPAPAKARAPKPKPPPDRGALDAAEAALAETQARHETDRRAQEQKERALADERRAMEQAHKLETRKLETARDAASDTYERALARWRG